MISSSLLYIIPQLLTQSLDPKLQMTYVSITHVLKLQTTSNIINGIQVLDNLSGPIQVLPSPADPCCYDRTDAVCHLCTAGDWSAVYSN